MKSERECKLKNNFYSKIYCTTIYHTSYGIKKEAGGGKTLNDVIS